MPKLILHYGTATARAFELKPGANFLGRDPGNDVMIDDASVSGSHAQLVVDRATATVTDLGSSNGTFIDREPVVEAVLQAGQFLRLGGVEMYFESEDLSFEPAAPAVTEVQATSFSVPPPPVTPVSAPPLAPRLPGVPVITQGPALCKIHPRSAARWQCPQCGSFYCELCVSSRRVSGGEGHFCRPCSVQCVPVTAPIGTADEEDEGDFYTQLPGAFLYPFKSGVGFVLVLMAVFFAVVGFFAGFVCFGFAIQFSILGYIFVYMQKIIQCSVQGEDREPPMPDVTNIAEDLIFPFLQLLATIIFCFWPAIGLAIWRSAGGPDWALWAVIPALGIGCLYFPMAFLTMATFDTVGAVSPTIVIPAITKIPLEYLTACFCLALVFVARWAGAFLLKTLIPIPIVPDLISSIVGLYFLAVQCRILGLLYYTNRHLLGWMRH